MSSKPPIREQQDTPVTVREPTASKAHIGQGPLFVAWATELATSLYALRLSTPWNTSVVGRISVCGELARECEALAAVFATWSDKTLPEQIHRDIAAWQDVKRRAREAGCEVP